MLSCSHWGLFEKPTAFNRSFQASMLSPYAGKLPQSAANSFYQVVRADGTINTFYQHNNFGKLD